jgi:hypothetical protein
MCSAVIAESSIIFEASSSVQLAAKPSPAASKSTQEYRDIKILRVRLTDYFMLARIISQGRIGKPSSS